MRARLLTDRCLAGPATADPDILQAQWLYIAGYKS